MATRRTDGDGSITWDASVQLWVGRLPRDERGRRAMVSAKTKAEVRAKLRQRLRERELGLSTDAGRATVGQFLDAWIREIVEPGHLASKTKQGYELTVRRHLVPASGASSSPS